MKTPPPRTEAASLVGLDRARLRELLAAMGEKPFRGDQLYNWIYARGIERFDEMTSLPLELRGRLEAEFRDDPPLEIRKTVTAEDGTRRYLFRTRRDDLPVEAVYIPDGRRKTVCISTQVGCRRGCRFCRTATVGFRRSLEVGEIVGQFMIIRRELAEAKGWNLVLMGMGEPLDNAEASAGAVALLADPEGLAVSRNRLTLSTVGVVPEMLSLAKMPVMPKIAVSLNATTDRVRSELMPVNRRYPLAELLEACRAIPLRRGNRITFEYVLLAGINDSDDDARRLPRLLRGIPAKVNLIPFNPFPGSPYRPPAPERVERFQELLLEASVSATIRRSRGAEIGAACGQLSGEEGDAPPDQGGMH